MRRRGTPLHLIVFVDERVERHPGFTRMIAGCCVFPRDRWSVLHGRAGSVREVRGSRRLGALEVLLDALPGFAMLVYADIPPDLLPPGEVDGCDDIARMSRTDNIWSQLVLSGVTAAIAFLQHPDASIGVVDVHFDRKDLTAAHRTQFENVLRETLPEIQRDAAVELPDVFGAGSPDLRFGTIASVGKPPAGAPPNEFQAGTNLAHHLCSQAPQVIARGPAGRIRVRDHTEVIRSMVRKFTIEPDGTTSPANVSKLTRR